MFPGRYFMPLLYHNQINARAVIGQSARVYRAGKPVNFACLLHYYIKAIDHKFLWFIN